MIVDRLDAELITAFVLGQPRSWVIAHENDELTEEQSQEIMQLLKRRRAGEPLAYITGVKEFYGRPFMVTPDVLIPRPATEALIDLTKKFLAGQTPESVEIDTGITGYVFRLSNTKPTTIIDAGTGSGCIAITLALEDVATNIVGIDTSEAALKIASKNRDAFKAVRVQFVHADASAYLASISEPFLLVSNPPYIPSQTKLEKTVAEFEPHEALFAGERGMDVLVPMIHAAKGNKHCCGIILEARRDQKEMIEASVV